MPRQHVLHYRQAQPGASGLPRTAVVHPVEALGETGDVAALDADPRVFHAEYSLSVAHLPRDSDRATLRGVAHCVRHQVGQCTREFLHPAHQPRIGFDRDAHVVEAAGEQSRLVGQLFHERADVDGLLVGGQA